MTYEQPADLNRFVAGPISSFWAGRWQRSRIYLPLLAFIAFCSVETLAWQLWGRDQLNLRALAPGLLPAAVLLVFILAWNEIRRFGERHSRRTLNLLASGISFNAPGTDPIPWPKVVAFWGEDVPGESQWSKVTIEYFGWRQAGPPLRRTIVLEKREQYPALLSELDRVRQAQRLGFRIELDQHLPPAPAPARHFMLGLWLIVAGMLLLLHGGPLLLASLANQHEAPGQAEFINAWPELKSPKLAAFVKAHFANAAEFRSCLAETGGALCVLGAAFCVAGNLAGRRKADHALPPTKGDAKR